MAKAGAQNNSASILKNALDVIKTEADEIARLGSRFREKVFKDNFVKTINLILECKGKIIVTGIGKSAIIAQKIVSTFNSTGTYSIFLHSADSLHGDLGMVRMEDIVIMISKSGDTEELKKLVPIFKELKVKIIAISGNTGSGLSKFADIVLDASVIKEACPHDLAPTSSTTIALVLGDAIAVTLLKAKDFTKEDFAMRHPGGMLGKKLLLKVGDLLSDTFPFVNESAGIKDVIYEISSGRLGCAIVLKGNKLKGFITDGDIRRLLEKDIKDISKVAAKDIMNKEPKTIKPGVLARTALELMEKNKITQLIIAEKKNIPVGVIHMHKLLEEGL